MSSTCLLECPELKMVFFPLQAKMLVLFSRQEKEKNWINIDVFTNNLEFIWLNRSKNLFISSLCVEQCTFFRKPTWLHNVPEFSI